jgi:type IV pilus assembly protein PilQ
MAQRPPTETAKSVTPQAAAAPQPAPPAAPTPPTETAKGVTQEAPIYVGERISLDFQNADINDILRLIAEVSGLNIIAGGDVQGTVTTRMVDVPWDQALDVILKINGLSQERDGNIIRVAPLARFIAERQDRARARQTADQSEPTVTQLIPVNYATASELRTNLERLLSNRGSILIDERTNTLIVTDTRKNLDDMLALVETLDRQTPQVMIEARIVETSRNFLQDLGVQLGAQYTEITNIRFPNRIDVGGSASTPGNFLVDLPAAVGQGSGGAITFALAGASNLLNLRLSALERTGRGKIISNPKIATLDNTEALIQSGRRIPVQTVSAEGTQTEFVDASLSLRVTPHVTPDGFISMRINATKNEADFGNAVNGVPSITTREATTQMLVKDNDTVVIGGLYRRTISSSNDGVPGVSRVPVLGWLFRSNQEQDDNDELLIFITPRIIRQPERPRGARTSIMSQ